MERYLLRLKSRCRIDDRIVVILTGEPSACVHLCVCVCERERERERGRERERERERTRTRKLYFTRIVV